MYLSIKRAMDFFIALVCLSLLAPFVLVIAFAIKIDSPGAILFKQKRFKQSKKHFFLFKFRTMRIDSPKDTPTHLLLDPDRWITLVGKVLRKTSLDELPQLVNILVGDMSIIGPRPALWNQHDLIYERDKYGANTIKPGLTGWAQINGRDELTIKTKAKLDGEYCKNIGMVMDVRCFFLTFIKIIQKDGFLEGYSLAKKENSVKLNQQLLYPSNRKRISREN